MKFEGLLERTVARRGGAINAMRANGARIEMTHSAVASEALALSERLLSAGLRPGHVVGIQLPNCYEFIVWDLACLHAQLVPEVYPEEMALDTETDASAALVVTQAKATQPFHWQIDADLSSLPSRVNPGAPRLHDDRVLTRVYSSGSSGYLKGLSISRSGTEHLISDFIRDFEVSGQDKHVLFLPLSNYQQRMSVYACLHTGADLVLRHMTELFAELRNDQPSFIIGPPVIYENIYNVFKNATAQAVDQFLGGQMRFMITGMAPIDREVLVGFNGQFGQCLLEAYGVTETGMLAWNTPKHSRIGRVGSLIDPQCVRFGEDGEVLVSKPYPLTLGYFRSREGEAEMVFSTDGTIATGDIGELDEDGFLRLKGRKKELIVTDGGEKIHPEQVEASLTSVAGVHQAAVFWDERRRCLGAVLVAAADMPGSKEVILDRAVEQHNAGASSAWRVGNWCLTTEPFSIDNGMLTRNLKLNRMRIRAAYDARANVA